VKTLLASPVLESNHPGDLAISKGSRPSFPSGHPTNLAGALERAARLYPQNEIFYLLANGKVEQQTYPELLNDAACILAGLRERRLQPGQPILFQLEHNRDFLGAFWACVLGGFVPVPVSIAPTYEQPHATLAKLCNAWTLLKAPPVLAGATLVPRLQALAQREGLADFHVVSVEALRRHPAAKAWHRSKPDDVALLLLTSGSTGLPKAVRQTHRRLLSWGASVVHACEFDHRDVSINWMPLDHVGGLVMFHLRDVVSGCRQGHAATELVLQQPLIWLDWIERYRATITWAPNFAFGLVNEQAEAISRRRWNLSSLRFILNGGEAIVSKTARRFLELLAPHGLPATAMRPAWGMSETCSGVTYSRRFTLATTQDNDPFVEVGTPIPGVQLRIVDSQDNVVPAGKIGRLQIQGISVTDGYHENPEANQAAFTRDGWFITGDLGVLHAGRLTITGREKDVIIINGVNFYSHEIESIVEAVKGVDVSFTAACAIRQPGENTDRLAVFFCPLPEAGPRLAALLREIRSAVAKEGGVTPDFLIPLAREDVPKTAIGKIQRSQLRERFEAGAYARQLARGENVATLIDLFCPAWKEIPGPAAAPALPEHSRVLILADPKGLGGNLAKRLRAAGHTCLVVRTHSDPTPLSPGDLRIDPRNPAEYALIFARFSGSNAFTHAVHAWSYPPHGTDFSDTSALEATQELGSLSLLLLLQAWPAPTDSAARVSLVVAASRTHLATDEDAIEFTKAPLAAIARTIEQEYAWLQCRHLDLSGDDPADDALRVEKEWADPTGEKEIALRRGKRFGRVLRPIEQPSSAESAAFEVGGVYAISGGFGGVGQVIALQLAQRYRAKLLIFGQATLPARSEWETCLRKDDTMAGRIRSWQAIESAGGEVRYAAGDIADAAFVRRAIEEATRTWERPLSGILHLAGSYHEAPLATETDALFWRAVRPKLVGGWVLQRAARDFPNCVFLHFSSLLSYFSSLGTASYSAANAALDSLAQQQRKQGLRSFSLLWSLWADTGMGGSFTDTAAIAVRGYLSLAPAQGFALLERAMQSNETLAVIGLDPKNRMLRRHLDSNLYPPEPDTVPEFVAPRNELERRLARMWEEILGLPKVGRTDNFFELGGRSLLAARLFARIEKECGQSLPLATLYQAPTLEKLAALLGQKDEAQPACRLLAIQPKGTRTPLFCIPGGGSDAIVFQDLSDALGQDQPLYGLQARGLDATPIAGEFPSVEEVAADFIAAIKKVQAQGPYVIGGHCFGCLLAWEVGRQLTQSGERVERLVLLDPIVSNVFSGEILGRDRLLYHFGKFWKMSLGDKARYFAEKVRNFNRTLVVRNRISHSYDQALSMHQRYQLRPYTGTVIVALAEDSFFKRAPERDPRRYYEKITQGAVDYFDVPGDHHGILHPPGVRNLAAELNARLPKLKKSKTLAITLSPIPCAVS